MALVRYPIGSIPQTHESFKRLSHPSLDWFTYEHIDMHVGSWFNVSAAIWSVAHATPDRQRGMAIREGHGGV